MRWLNSTTAAICQGSGKSWKISGATGYSQLGRGLQIGRGSGQQCVAVAVQRRIDTPGVDGLLGVLRLLAARDDVAVPALGVYRAGRSQVENRYIPGDPQRLHLLAQEI